MTQSSPSRLVVPPLSWFFFPPPFSPCSARKQWQPHAERRKRRCFSAILCSSSTSRKVPTLRGPEAGFHSRSRRPKPKSQIDQLQSYTVLLCTVTSTSRSLNDSPKLTWGSHFCVYYNYNLLSFLGTKTELDASAEAVGRYQIFIDFFCVPLVVYSALGAEPAAHSVQSLLELFYIVYIRIILYILHIYLVPIVHTTYQLYYATTTLWAEERRLQRNYNELAIYTFKVESENHWGCNMCLWKSSVISNVVVAASMKRETPFFKAKAVSFWVLYATYYEGVSRDPMLGQALNL